MIQAFLAGYLLGSLPFAFWFGALRGKNLLVEGTKDPGGAKRLPSPGAGSRDYGPGSGRV